MLMAGMSLWFETVTANVKVVAGEAVVGWLVESVTCAFTNGTPPIAILIF